jgi:tetratricopeptide (TPR) repeat protein
MSESGSRPPRSAGGERRSGSARGGRGRGGSSGGAGPRGAGAGRPDPGTPATGRSDRPSRPRRDEPPLPADVTGAELDRSVRAELASLAKVNAEIVAKHLVVAARLLDSDPELAYQHARAARERAGRIGAVREAAGLAAYRAGQYADALSELRAARRISGDQSLLAVMADCERGLGRPERALAMTEAPEVSSLGAATRVELKIVASGARRDLGQPDAAVLVLQGPQLRPEMRRPWSARLFYAYAEALADAGRDDEAVTWLRHAAAADTDGETDAAERLDVIDGVGADVAFLDEEPEGAADTHEPR